MAKMPQSLGKRKRKKINYREEHGIREAAARLDSESDLDVGAEGGSSDSVSHAWHLVYLMSGPRLQQGISARGRAGAVLHSHPVMLHPV